jgi:predicted AlkP superfamily phosphohydrolase/phosphomutase
VTARAALALLLLVAVGCGDHAGRVIVLGVDGLHLPLLDQLVAEGRLPNFARLYHEGTVGGVSTAAAGLPPSSPRVWTTFATGVLPDEHGIVHFVFKDPKGVRRLFSSRERRAAAVWEIASAAHKRVGLVNWIVSYPAEPVNGFDITERYLPLPSQTLAQWQQAKFERRPEGLVHPPALAETLLALPIKPQKSLANTPELAEEIDRNVFALAYAALDKYPVDLLMVYTRSMDEIGHLWWASHEPLPGEPRGHDMVVDYIVRYDGLLGEFLSHLNERDRLVVLSDHGMERNRGEGLSGQHSSEGVAVGVGIWWGPGIPAGRRLSASLLDIAPTLLEMLGIPPSEAMPGKVLTDVLPAGHALLPRRKAPYPRLATPAAGDEKTAADPAIIEKLRALGYVD